MKTASKALLILPVMLALSACGQDSDDTATIAAPEPTSAEIARAEELLPTDPALSAIYERSCMSCHSLVDAEAPLTGHKAAWDVLIAAKGKAGLLQSAKNGFNNMPALGYCADCSDEDFTALIGFMAGEKE